MLDTTAAASEDLLPILRRHGVVRAGLFGSRARGEATDTSDLDLLVEFEKGRSLFDLAGLRLDLSEHLGHEVDVVTYGSLHRLLRDRVLAEEVRLL